ncbi:MAG: glycosyltransferase [Halioglobus sp.]
MIVSIETPVFKGKWLTQCIDSVLTQSSPNWTLSLCWDGGDEQSRKILEALDARNLPNVTVYFEENRGIANARHFISARSEGDYILPLDDDDVLTADAVEKLLAFVEAKPWSGIVRGRRKFIDEAGVVVDEEPWFPFEPRHYQHGMVTDVFNHSQPYLIKRSLYNQTAGWEGFEDFMFAGEDCDIILKLEELAPIELLDDVLYYYRLNSNRASDALEVAGAHEMWRRLADKSIARMGLPLERKNDVPPYIYGRLPRSLPDKSMIDFIVPGEGGLRGFFKKKRLLRTLKRNGITEDAVHFVQRDEKSVATIYNEGFQQTARPLVCFLHQDTIIKGSGFFDTLLATMHEELADIIGPRLLNAKGATCCANPYFNDELLPETHSASAQDERRLDAVSEAQWLPNEFLLVRREVMNAVAGFDAGYGCSRIESADFCLKARFRDFKCLYAGASAVVCNTFSDSSMQAEFVGLQAFHEKWSGYDSLFWR